MSQVLIQQYLNQLQDLRKVSGTHRESVIREAFKDLLKGWARSRDLIFGIGCRLLVYLPIGWLLAILG